MNNTDRQIGAKRVLKYDRIAICNYWSETKEKLQRYRIVYPIFATGGSRNEIRVSKQISFRLDSVFVFYQIVKSPNRPFAEKFIKKYKLTIAEPYAIYKKMFLYNM